MKTIWGQIQHQHKLAGGVYEVDTASHGGIIVSTKVADRYLSHLAKEIAGEPKYGYYHFEEDCDWAVFAYENPTIVRAEMRKYYMESLKRWNSDYLYKKQMEEYVLKTLTRELTDKLQLSQETIRQIVRQFLEGTPKQQRYFIDEFDIDSIRVCDHCGKLMHEGYMVEDFNTYCSETCVKAGEKWTEETFQENISHAEEDDAIIFYTQWEY